MAESGQTNTSKVTFSVNLRYVCAALLLIIIGMLVAWKPWVPAPSDNARTVTVSGEAKVTAKPDEFVFYPTYEFKNDNKDAALASLTKKSEEITAKLKSLDVPEDKIKTDSSGHEGYIYYYNPETRQSQYSLRFTVTVGTQDLAQKIQDYLITTAPSGSVSPQATFSDAKRKQLETQARDDATKEARTKAEQSARNLGFKIGRVKAVDDGNGFNGPIPYARGSVGTMSAVAEDTKSLAVQPGTNDLTYTVTVEYYIK